MFLFFFFKPPTFILLVVYKVTDCRESLKLRITLVWSLLINSRSNFSSPKLLFIHQHLWCSTVVLLAHYWFFRYVSCFLVIKPSYSLHHISHSQYINSWFIAYTNFVNQNRNGSKFWERSSKLPQVKLQVVVRNNIMCLSVGFRGANRWIGKIVVFLSILNEANWLL